MLGSVTCPNPPTTRKIRAAIPISYEPIMGFSTTRVPMTSWKLSGR